LSKFIFIAQNVWSMHVLILYWLCHERYVPECRGNKIFLVAMKMILFHVKKMLGLMSSRNPSQRHRYHLIIWERVACKCHWWCYIKRNNVAHVSWWMQRKGGKIEKFKLQFQYPLKRMKESMASRLLPTTAVVVLTSYKNAFYFASYTK